MSDDPVDALSRLSRLIALDCFAGDLSTEPLIAAGLRSTTASIVSDAANASTQAGQTAIVTLHNQLLMLGLQVDADVPDMDLVAQQPPLVGTTLATALAEYAADLIPGGSRSPSTAADIVFVIGDTPYAGSAVRLCGDDLRCSVAPNGVGIANRWHGSSPFGPMAAAAAAAADGIRAALPRIAELLERPTVAERQWLLNPSRSTLLDLSGYGDLTDVRLGAVDLVSGGAITSAALYTLLRVPGVDGALRVIENDSLDVSNLNRYPLARFSQVTMPKAALLAALSTNELRIVAVRERLEQDTLAAVGPLAPRVLVGVDDIASRWFTQNLAADSALFVGATSHDFVYTSVHRPGEPCAGCAHPKTDPTIDLIPTMSFVSMWAGLLQAMDLLAHAKSPGQRRAAAYVNPLALEHPRGIHRFALGANSACPVGCDASRRLRTVA